VATMTGALISVRNEPIICSLRPSPYTSAVSKKGHTRINARLQHRTSVLLLHIAPVSTQLPRAETDNRYVRASPPQPAMLHAGIVSHRRHNTILATATTWQSPRSVVAIPRNGGKSQ
jgi:hypothetical protein